MSALRADLLTIVEQLLAGTKVGDAIQLDTMGEAIGLLCVGSDEIDAMIALLEEGGRRVVTRKTAGGERALKTVLSIARLLRAELGRAPGPKEIAVRAGLPEADVRHALDLAKIMQR